MMDVARIGGIQLVKRLQDHRPVRSLADHLPSNSRSLMVTHEDLQPQVRPCGVEVLDRQLAHLSKLGSIDYSWISIRVLPFGARAHTAAGSGRFSILQFVDIPELVLPHLGGPAGGLCLYEPPLVRRTSRSSDTSTGWQKGRQGRLE